MPWSISSNGSTVKSTKENRRIGSATSRFASRLDQLHRHLKDQHIEFLQFAFRWMNNLLMRELPIRCTIRLWDTYLVRFCHSVSLSSPIAFLSSRLNKTDSHNFICTHVLHFSNDFPRIFSVNRIFKSVSTSSPSLRPMSSFALSLGFTPSSPESADTRLDE